MRYGIAILLTTWLLASPTNAQETVMKSDQNKATTSTSLSGKMKTTSTAITKKASGRKSSNNIEMDTFIANLMSKMTLAEKIGQMNLLSVGADVTGPILSQGVEEKIAKGQVGGVFNLIGPNAVSKLQKMVMSKSRLKIPLIFGYDVIHGHRTIFPIPLGLSASWDLDLIERTASAAAQEATADGINWVFSPMVDITRDPRWGRVCEGSGEDPYLGSQIARAMVRGYQGNGSIPFSTDKLLACVKHFALYGAAEAGRDYNTVDMSRQKMFNDYFPAYKAAVDSGVASVMTSFNEIDGVPATGNKWLMTDLLRKNWGFKGFIATDYTAIPEMIEHGVGDQKKVTELAFNAGVDMDMVGELFTKYGAQLIKEKKVSPTEIDDACRRILEAKYKLGLFENPYRYINYSKQAEIMTTAKLTLSKEAAVRSMVLLKNDSNVLPLKSEQKVAFIGPLVKDQRNVIGSWSANGQGKEAQSLWSGLLDRETKIDPARDGSALLYAKGCNIIDDPALIERLNRDGAELVSDSKSPAGLIDEAVQVASKADVIVAVLGEPFSMSGEAASRSDIRLPENQLDLLKALKKLNKPVVLVLMNGRPLAIEWEAKNVDGILEAWFGGTRTGGAITDILYGDENPTGRLTMTFPRNAGQIPIYYASKNTGRPYVANSKFHSQYLDIPNTPLYPFGYGLSYSDCTYGDVTLSSKTLKPGTKLVASVKLTNSGSRKTVETVQLYIRDMVGSITRPVKQLKGFQRVTLEAGESTKVHFELTEADLRFYNGDLKFVAEPGKFKVFIGKNSQDVKEAEFDLVQ